MEGLSFLDRMATSPVVQAAYGAVMAAFASADNPRLAGTLVAAAARGFAQGLRVSEAEHVVAGSPLLELQELLAVLGGPRTSGAASRN